MYSFEIRTNKRCSMTDITARAKEAVLKSGAAEGVVTVYCPHTTAGITINENADPDVVADMLKGLDAIVPNIAYAHAEGNSDAHIKATMVGSSAQIPFSGGELATGIWQSIYFCEFDGPRNRRFFVSVCAGC